MNRKKPEAKYQKTCKECGTEFLSLYNSDKKGIFCKTNCYRNWKQRYDRANKPGFMAIQREYSRLGNIMKSKGLYCTKPIKNIGCTSQEFKEHIASLFKGAMSWDNYGEKWEFNHIKSLQTAFDEGGEEAVARYAHYTNVEPIYIKKNRKARKGRQFVEERKPAWIPIPKAVLECKKCGITFETIASKNKHGKCRKCTATDSSAAYQRRRRAKMREERLLKSHVSDNKTSDSDSNS